MTPLEADPVYQRMRSGLLRDIAHIEAGGTPERAYSTRGERLLQWRPAPKFHRRWTEAERRHLVEMRRDGASAPRIAQELKRTLKGVKQQVTRLRREGHL